VVAKLQATRVSGVAPLAVLFDSTSTTAASGVDTFRQITYSFDFGDDRGQIWAVSGQPKNTQTGGPLAAHVFDVAGTYMVKVRATDASGAYSDASVAVTVQNADAFYAATKTICVSPSSNFTDCPSGSAQQTSMPSGTGWSGKRVLLHTGEKFGDISILDGNSAVQVGSYGTGAKPVVASVGIGNWQPQTTAFPTDITVMDLNVSNQISQSLGSRVLVLRNDVHLTPNSSGIPLSMGEQDYWYRGDPNRKIPQSAFYNAREIFFVENNALGSDTNTGVAGFWGDGSRVALLGNRFGKYQQHSARFSALNKSVLAHNEFQGISSDGIRLALKLHSMGYNDYTDGAINDTSGRGGWATNQIVIANNVFGNAADNNAWTVAVAPQNDTVEEGIQNVILENNRFYRGKNTSTDLIIAGRFITYRKNTVVGGGALNVGTDNGVLPAAWTGPNYSSQ
jgi:hypothetical protein